MQKDFALISNPTFRISNAGINDQDVNEYPLCNDFVSPGIVSLPIFQITDGMNPEKSKKKR